MDMTFEFFTLHTGAVWITDQFNVQLSLFEFLSFCLM